MDGAPSSSPCLSDASSPLSSPPFPFSLCFVFDIPTCKPPFFLLSLCGRGIIHLFFKSNFDEIGDSQLPLEVFLNSSRLHFQNDVNHLTTGTTSRMEWQKSLIRAAWRREALHSRRRVSPSRMSNYVSQLRNRLFGHASPRLKNISLRNDQRWCSWCANIFSFEDLTSTYKLVSATIHILLVKHGP